MVPIHVYRCSQEARKPGAAISALPHCAFMSLSEQPGTHHTIWQRRQLEANSFCVRFMSCFCLIHMCVPLFGIGGSLDVSEEPRFCEQTRMQNERYVPPEPWYENISHSIWFHGVVKSIVLRKVCNFSPYIFALSMWHTANTYGAHCFMFIITGKEHRIVPCPIAHHRDPVMVWQKA